MLHKFTPSDIQRFWSKVDRSGGPDACWPWTAGKFAGKDYGVFRAHGKNYRSHRFAYIAAHGPIPEGLLVCHRCDNPECCNPAHLWLGTPADNMADMVAKGRSLKGIDSVPPETRARGERNGALTHPERLTRGTSHHASKLTPDLVRSIRTRFAAGETQTAIAASIGVSQPVVSSVVRGETWGHVE